MSQVKTKGVKMLRDARGCPAGHTVVEYKEGQIVEDMGLDLADAFIADGAAEALPEKSTKIVVADWPPTDEAIDQMSFSALGVLLETKNVPLGPLKSEELRRTALRDVIESEIVVPWEAGHDEGKLPDRRLVKALEARGVDVAGLKTRDEAEAALRKALGIDDEFSGMTQDQLVGILKEKGVDLTTIHSEDEARDKLRELKAAEAHQ